MHGGEGLHVHLRVNWSLPAMAPNLLAMALNLLAVASNLG